MNTQIFSYSHELKQLSYLALPIIASQFLQASMGLIDTVMAGHINALNLAALSLGTTVWHFIMVTGMGLLLALPPLLSEHIGAKNPNKARRQAQQGIWLALIVGGFLSLLAILTGLSLPYIGIEESIVEPAQSYIYWICWSLPFSCLYLIPRAFNEANNQTMPMLWIQILALPLNILGNCIFMMGYWNIVPAMGASGAALSTGLAQLISCIALFIYTLYSPRYSIYKLRTPIIKPSKKNLMYLLTLGVPICIAIAMEVGMFSIVTLFMGQFGVTATAAHQVAMSVAAVVFMIPLGLSMAITVRVAQANGAKQPIEARKRGQLGIAVSVCLVSLVALFFILFGKQIAQLYTSDPEIVIFAAQFLLFAALFQVVDALQVCANGALRGYKDTKVPMILAVICYWVIGIGSGIILSHTLDFGPQGLWIGLIIGLSSAALALNSRLYYISSKRIQTIT